MSEPYEITEKSELDSLVDSGEQVVVRFTAEWCAPCKQLAPHIATAAEKRPDVNFVYVDVDKAPWAMVDFGIRSVPQVFRYNDGQRQEDVKGRTVISILSELD